MNSDGTVKAYYKISDTHGNFRGILDDIDNFGGAVANLVNLGSNNAPALAVTTLGDDDGGTGLFSSITFTADAGTTYYIVVPRTPISRS